MIHRIIGRLDIKGHNLVKGIHLEGLRVLGRPEEFAKYYYENGIDELIYIDVVASLFGRNSLKEIITKTAKEIFIPLTVGGGLRTTDDIRDVLRAGADKVSLNTAAIKNPKIIREASKIFGSSTITVTIEAIKQKDGSYLVFTDNGREYTGVEVLGWAKKVEGLGAGEILLTSIDRDGTGEGFDAELLQLITKNVSIPVIASGGAGSKEDAYKAISEGGADAVSLASLLHYSYLQNNPKQMKKIIHEGNTEFLKSGQVNSRISATNIGQIKSYLKNHKVMCRI